MSETRPSPSEADPFFIGWNPMPPSYRRFLGPIIGLLIVAGLSVAFLLPLLLRSPEPAAWETDESAFEGIVSAAPYALLRTRTKEGTIRTLLLVEEGKRGAAERVRPFDGQWVRVRGTLLHRDGYGMVELAVGEHGLEPLSSLIQDTDLSLKPTPPREHVTLHGEIVDAKCYLGAMKPGVGKTHKACAALCLAGGIPPLFVARDPTGQERVALLTSPEGGPLDAEAKSLVGEPVTLTGKWAQQGDLAILAVSGKDVRRR